MIPNIVVLCGCFKSLVPFNTKTYCMLVKNCIKGEYVAVTHFKRKTVLYFAVWCTLTPTAHARFHLRNFRHVALRGRLIQNTFALYSNHHFFSEITTAGVYRSNKGMIYSILMGSLANFFQSELMVIINYAHNACEVSDQYPFGLSKHYTGPEH